MLNMILFNLKRILRDFTNIIFMIIAPVVIISFVASNSGSGGKILCGVVDHDNTAFSQSIVSRLEKDGNVRIIQENEVREKLLGQILDYAIVIDKGFTEGIILGKDVKLASYNLNQTNVSIPAVMNLESYINSARNIAVASGASEDKFYQGLQIYSKNNLEVIFSNIEDKSNAVGKTTLGLGFLVMNMLFLAGFAPALMLRDKQNNTFYRIMAAPVTIKKYMAAYIISFFLLSFLQVTLLFGFMGFNKNIDLGTSPILLFMLSLLFSLVCVAMGVAINTLSKNRRQAGLVSSLLLTPMCMLGGCWWPFDIMPDTLQKIANFVPTKWIMQAYSKSLHGGTIDSLIPEISVLGAFIVVFFLLASWKKTEVAN